MRTIEAILLTGADAFKAHPQADVPEGERPAAVAVPTSVEEVQLVVRHAAETGLRVAVHTTGRGVRQTGRLDDTLLVQTRELGGARLDAPARIVRAGGGALWSDVSRAAAPAGLAALAVPTPSVGVVGTVLAGGVGWLSRRHGLASESLRAVELVTADGRLVRADPDRERDLFWALRGGGGGLGVVTAVELALVEPAPAQGGTMRWPAARAREVMHAWREWTLDLPREVTSMARLAGGGDEAATLVEAVLLADDATSGELLAPLRALAPEREGIRPIAAADLDTLHPDVLGERPVYYDHLLLHDLPEEALDLCLDLVGPAAGFPLLDLELRHLGGALDDRRRHRGALGSLDAGYLLVVAAAPERADVARELVEELSPWAAGHIFLSFVTPDTPDGEVFPADTRRRLWAVKALYDPEDRFVAPLGHITGVGHPLRDGGNLG